MKQYIRQAQYKKGFANIILIVLVVVLAGALGYITLVRKSAPVAQVPSLTEPEAIASLKIDWQTVQALIPFRPTYHNQAENAAKIWRTPTAAQFIGKNAVLVRFEDDNNVHVAVFNFDGGKFNLLETLQNQGEFASSDWQNLITKYGATSYSPSTYTKDLMRNGKIVSFQDLTKVPENVFVKNYWQNTSPSIILPPDPGEAGKVTLAGIDSDGDGLRDDVQRYIALTYPNSARTRAALTQYSRSAQKTVLESLDKDRSISNIHGEISANRCLAYVLGDGVAAVSVYKALRARILNTIDRSRAYLAADSFMEGQVLQSGSRLADQKVFCLFNPDELAN